MERGVRLAWTAAVCGALLAAPVRAEEPDVVRLSPSTAWVLDYDDDSCALRRAFGEEGQRVQLELRRFGPRQDLQVIVASRDLHARTGAFTVQFAPLAAQSHVVPNLLNLDYGDGLRGRLFVYNLSHFSPEYDSLYDGFISSTSVLTEEERAQALEGTRLRRQAVTADGNIDERLLRRQQRISLTDSYQSAIRRVDAAFQNSDGYRAFFSNHSAQIAGIGLYDAFGSDVFLETGSLQPAMEAMDGCVDELLAHWGIDVEAHRNLSRGVEPYDYDRLVDRVSRDFPVQMVREGRPGILWIRLSVSAEGAPTECHVQTDLSDEAFKETACDNMMRFARFHPALDATGQPVASYFQVSVQYII